MEHKTSVASLFSQNRVCRLLGIDYPIIQAGMVWVSGNKLAAAAANSGCLGVIGAGSMKPDLLKEHILKAQKLTKKPIAINVPLFMKYAKEQIETALDLGIRIFITSAGSPKIFTSYLKEKNCVVLHVTSTPELAKKCEDAGVDAVIVEGFEAGGHNGRDELTTFALIPQSKDKLKIPLIAAGGIGDGRGIAAAFCLGAEGVQIGTRFLATVESSAHPLFKQKLLAATSTDTMLCMKELIPVRLLKNTFYHKVYEIESVKKENKESLERLLGKGRAKKGMLEGDLEDGELEVGQIAAMISDLPKVEELVPRLLAQWEESAKNAWY